MGVLCPPNSSTAYRDLPVEQQIGGYPTSGQLSDSVDEQTLDSEGRCVILEFPAFVLIGVYSPATRDETRTEFREAYIDAMNVRIRNLVAMGKQVFLCGDLNIVRSEMDTAGLAERLRKEGMTIDDFFSMPSRQFLNNLVFGGRAPGEEGNGSEGPVLWDLCREFHPTRAGMYTCWDTRKNARPGNFGSRIDYVLCSSGIKDWFVDSNIQEGLLGSDHCPVYATISDTVSVDDNKVPIEDVMNPTGMFENGQRQREWSSKDLLPTSAKLIPEFDRRQSIKDMFFKKAAPSATTKQKPMAENSQKTQTVREVIHPNINNKELDGKNIPAASQPSEKVPRGTTESTDKSRSDASSAFSMHSLPPKRQATSAVTPTRPQKKGKLIPDKDSSTKSSLGRSQSSLKGFFKPKDSGAAASTKLGDDGITKAAANSINSPGNLGPKHDGQRIATLEAQSAESAELDLPKTASGTQNPGSPSDKVFDPIEAKESWSKLLGKRIVPKCEHGDDCQSLVTKKPGINCGMYILNSSSRCPFPRWNRPRTSDHFFNYVTSSRTLSLHRQVLAPS